MTGAKHTKPMGVKKEKQMANPVRASTTKKAKDAAKVAMKKASKKPNKENVTSSTATAQLHAKPSQQKSQGTSHEHSPSPDIDALRARIKELEGIVIDYMYNVQIYVLTISQRLPEHRRVSRPRRRKFCSLTGLLVRIITCRQPCNWAMMIGLTMPYVLVFLIKP